MASLVALSVLGASSCGALTREFFPDEGADAGAGDAAVFEGGAVDGGWVDARCTVPEDCPDGRVCERLSGACLSPSSVRCGLAARTDLSNIPREGGEGDLCVRAFDPGDASCAATQGTCADPHVCVRASPFEDRQAYCGWPGVKLGVCRMRCDPCANVGCPAQESCMYITGFGGACFPRAPAVGLCGRFACPPGDSCILNNGPRCERACESDGDCLSGTLCAGMFDGTYCARGERTVGVGEVVTPGVTVCDPRTSYQANASTGTPGLALECRPNM